MFSATDGLPKISGKKCQSITPKNQFQHFSRDLFLKWGDFIEHEIIQSYHETPNNVVQINFGKK